MNRALLGVRQTVLSQVQNFEFKVTCDAAESHNLSEHAAASLSLSELKAEFALFGSRTSNIEPLKSKLPRKQKSLVLTKRVFRSSVEIDVRCSAV